MDDNQFPIRINLLGMLLNEKTKLYMTSVLWSDQTETVAYRSLPEFKKMHKDLPPRRKTKKSDRVLPQFRYKTAKHKYNRAKEDYKPLVFFKFLQEYCDNLLTCNAKVTQNMKLINFLRPTDQDLKRDHSTGSLLLVREEKMISDIANVTQPFVTETYKCIAPYETKDTRNKPFKVMAEDKLDVLIKDSVGWWLVENEEKRMAWFPAPYLEKIDGEEEDDTEERGMLYTAVKKYTATKDDEISVSLGGVVEVLQKSDMGWWLVSFKGKVGYIPAMYLQPCNNLQFITQQPRSASLFVPPTNLEQQSLLSRSHGNLLQPPSVKSSSPNQIHPVISRSLSLNELTDHQPRGPNLAPDSNYSPPETNYATFTTPTLQSPLPVIMVEGDEEETDGRRVSLTSVSVISSDVSSFSDDFSSSSSLSTCSSANDDRLQLSRTPPPTTGNYLSPTSNKEVKLTPSVSDPSLFKSPASPKIPPRPQAREILSRCTTITRKNAAKDGTSPT